MNGCEQSVSGEWPSVRSQAGLTRVKRPFDVGRREQIERGFVVAQDLRFEPATTIDERRRAAIAERDELDSADEVARR